MKNKTKTDTKTKAVRRQRGEHSFLYSEIDFLVPRCKTCGCDEDDAFVGGLECSFNQKKGWNPTKKFDPPTF